MTKEEVAFKWLEMRCQTSKMKNQESLKQLRKNWPERQIAQNDKNNYSVYILQKY